MDDVLAALLVSALETLEGKHALLDNLEILTERQRRVVQLYYRENLQQKEIAEILKITQQAVGDALQRARATVGNKLRRYFRFL